MMSIKSLSYNLLCIVDLAIMAVPVCAVYDFLIFEFPAWIMLPIYLYFSIRFITLPDCDRPTFATAMILVYILVGIISFFICLNTAYLDNTMTVYSENGKYGIKSKHTSHIFAESVYDTVYSRKIVNDVWYAFDDAKIKQSSRLVFFLEKDNKFGLVKYKEVVAQPVFDSIVITRKCYAGNACYDVFKCYADSSIKTIDYAGSKPPETLRVVFRQADPVNPVN